MRTSGERGNRGSVARISTRADVLDPVLEGSDRSQELMSALARAITLHHNAAMHNERIAAPAVERTVIEAIALRRLIAAVYNGSDLLLAPHRLFTRHGALFVSALNTGKLWRSEEERRLGHYKLDGLSDLVMTETDFEPLADDAEPARAGDELVFAVA